MQSSTLQRIFQIIIFVGVFLGFGFPALSAGTEIEKAVSQENTSDKLFYAVDLNQSLFINEREMLCNARVNVNVLQGNFSGVTFEIVGNGTIENITGEQVKDWSIRRSGARRFVEIRAKEGLTEGKKFKATIVGRTSLDLPTTIYPFLLANVDATSFQSILRIIAIPDLRLYARQARGLIPIGVSNLTELNFTVMNSPALRLDIARANELLAPVSLEAFTLSGEVGERSGRFRMKATASVREPGAEIAVLSGNAALRNFPQDSVFSVRTELDKNSGTPIYFFKFPQRGDFSLDLEFDAHVREREGWRELNFIVPAIQVAPFFLKGLPKNIAFSPMSVSIPQLSEDTYKGFLPASGEFNLRWQERSDTPAEFSACVFSADTCSEWKIATGILAQQEEVQLTISQGALSNLVFKLYGEGNILDVTGEDILSWHVEEKSDEGRELHVALSQQKRGNYSLRIKSQVVFNTFPATFNPLRIVPVSDQPDSAVCVRFNEFLRLRNNGFVRFDVIPQAGITQIAPAAFPRRGEYFDANVPEEGLVAYRLATNVKALTAVADIIRPDVSVRQFLRCYFDNTELVVLGRLELNVRAAPIYEWIIQVPEEFLVDSINSEYLASYEQSKSENGFKNVRIAFTAPQKEGLHELSFVLRKNEIALGESYTLRGIRHPQARFVSGFIGLDGAQKTRLLPIKLKGVTEVPVEFYPLKRGQMPQQVFRMREADWEAQLRVERMLTERHGDVSTVYGITGTTIRGNAKVRYHAGTEFVDEIRFQLPQGGILKKFEGEGFETPKKEGEIWTCLLRTPKQGEFDFSIDFELPPAKRNQIETRDFSGIKLLDVAGEIGEIFITASDAVAISSVEPETVETKKILKLSKFEAKKPELSQRGEPILLGAYQYVERPFDMDLDFAILPEQNLAPFVITDAKIYIQELQKGCFKQTCLLHYLNGNDEAQTLQMRLPVGAKEVLFSGMLHVPHQNSFKKGENGNYFLKLAPGKGYIHFSFSAEEQNPKESFTIPQFDVPILKTSLFAAGEFVGLNFNKGGYQRTAFTYEGIVKNIKNFFSHWATLVPVGILLASVLILLSAPLPKVLAGILKTAGSASLAGTIVCIGKFVLDNFGANYSDSVATFSEGEALKFGIEFWHSLLPLNEAETAGILAVGILILSAGTLLIRKAWLRWLGRICVYGGILTALPNFKENLLGALIFVASVETMTWGIEICLAIKEKFMFRKKQSTLVTNAWIGFLLTGSIFIAGTGTPLKAQGTVPAENQSVITQEENFFEDEIIAPKNIAERISQVLKILPDRMVAAGQIRVKGKAGERFDLLASPAVLTHFEKASPEAAIRLERRRGKTGIVYQIVIEKTGTFSANFSYEQAIVPETRGISLCTGNAAADVATLILLRQDIQIGAEGAVTIENQSREEINEKAQISQIVFKPLADRKIYWKPRERDRGDENLELFAETTNLYVPASGVIEGYHVIRLTPAHGEFDAVAIEIPKNFSVSRVEGNSIRRWNFGRDRILTILLDSRKSEACEISVYTQAPLDIAKVQNFHSLFPKTCLKTMSTIGIATGGDLQIDEISAPGMVLLDETEFSGKLIEQARSAEPEAQLRRVYRRVAEEARCQVKFSEVKARLRTNSIEKITLNRDKISLEAELTAQVSFADVFSLNFILPEGLEVESITGDTLSYWAETQENQVRRVTLYLKKQCSEKEKFKIVLSGAFPIGATIWNAPRLIVEDAEHQLGETFIVAQEGLRLSLRSRDDIVETRPQDSSREDLQDADFSLKHFGKKWNASFSVSSSNAQAEAQWTQEVFPAGRYFRVETKIVYSVENSLRQIVRVKLPKNALAPRVNGQQVINVLKGENSKDENIQEIRLAKPMRGEIPFNLQYFIPVEEKTKIKPIAVEDIEEERGQIVIHGIDLLDSKNPIEADAEFSFSKDSALAKNFAGKTATLNLSSKVLTDWENIKTDITEGAFSKINICRTTEIFSKTAITEEQISMNANHAELLRITPGKAKILAAFVNGVPVKLFLEDENVLYLPVKGTPAGKNCTVTLIYQNKFSNGKMQIAPIETSALSKKLKWGFRSGNKELPIDQIIFSFNGENGPAYPKKQKPEMLSGSLIEQTEIEFLFDNQLPTHISTTLKKIEKPTENKKEIPEKFIFIGASLVLLIRTISLLAFRRKK